MDKGESNPPSLTDSSAGSEGATPDCMSLRHASDPMEGPLLKVAQAREDGFSLIYANFCFIQNM